MLTTESTCYKDKKKIVFGRYKVDSNTIGTDNINISRKHLHLFESLSSKK